eukprot:TRINITY_DN97183_c0_g1_i1.p1 TRINITY_DN97183_c0_g1~~TRINITY_DN97183_c0_g1_i1.p1  ORF type:complete len:162 (+),score=38.61 TRINITY_DN97183_c0_g1_i1:113-598(+)
MGGESSKCCRCDDAGDEELHVKSGGPQNGRAPGIPLGNLPSLSEDQQSTTYIKQAPASFGPAAPQAVQEQGEDFKVNIKKRPGARLGIDIDLSDGVTLLIETVNTGLISEWNDADGATLGKKVQSGDRIVAVNGKSGDAQILADRCVKDDVLDLTLRRGAM